MPTSRGGRQVYQNLAWRLGFVESIAAYFFRNMAKGWLRGSRRGVKGSQGTKHIYYYSNGHDLDAITTSRVLQQCR